MNKRGLLGLIVIVGVLVVVGFFWFIGQWNSGGTLLDNLGNQTGQSCVAASCCHAKNCVWENEAPDCNEALCTLSCEPGTMDCGRGACGVVENECGVIWNE